MTESLKEDHQSLIARVAVGRDREAFRALFVHFAPRIKALMLRSGANDDQAEDLVQEVMTTVWRKVDLYNGSKGTVSAWIYAIARNARVDRLRRRSSQPYEDVDSIELASDDMNSEDETQAAQVARHVAEALTELPEDQRQVINLAYVEDLSQTEIAEKLSLPLGTVKSRTRLAFARLKTRLVHVQ